MPNIQKSKDRPWNSRPVARKNQGREERSSLYDSARWRKLRVQHFMEYPLCVHCEEAGRASLAVILDHIIPHRIDKSIDFFDRRNHQGLCNSCHNKKSALERRVYDYQSGSFLGEVTVVYGPPGSGKTTWAGRQGPDLLIDMDVIWMDVTGLGWYEKPESYLPQVYQARDQQIDSIVQLRKGQKAIVVTTNLSVYKIQEAVLRYKPKLVRMEVTEEECIERIMKDHRRQDKQHHIALVHEWFKKHKQ
ncbi:HNH endonuclease [Pontibacter ummariensis]|uniref:HNH endonuclease n=1 Tax=Pontibacter ummariensis TaxID=1610492 RepID=A0A239HKH6_9BACT|nr:AAA family ATPase [Pontibacter ummariensis]PRY10297.1 HNH endonuclease [Pontibacter ummariensis]SNS81655.1 HNH endonuclease [Pontibacter ummariensis]